MILPAKLVNERLMFLIDYGDKLPWGSVVTGAKIEVTVSSGEDTTPQKVFSQVWDIDGTIVTYQVRNGLPGVVYDLNTAVQVSGEWLYMTVKLAVLPDSGDVGALYPLTRVFTSLPYVQLMTDEINQSMEPTSGVLVQVLYESDLQPANVDLTMEPTGGDLLIPPPGETFSESEMGLIPTDGDLFTPPPANIDPNSAVANLALEPSTGILAVPPLGELQIDKADLAFIPTGGDLAIPSNDGSGILSKLTSFWELTESSGTRNDSVGTNHLSVYGTVSTATGLRGTELAANFPGGNGTCLYKANNTSLQTPSNGACAMFGWYKRTSAASNSTLVSKWDATSGSSVERSIALTTSTIGATFQKSGTYLGTTQTLPTDGSWHFFVVWVNPADKKPSIQVDDGTVTTNANAIDAITTSTDFALGGTGGPGYRGYFSHIGPMQYCGWIRGNILTAAERTWLYNGGTGRTYAEIVAAAVPTVTWNPSDKSSLITLSSGDLVATRTGTTDAYGTVRATQARDAADPDGFYFEVVVTNASSSIYVVIGVANASQSLSAYVGDSTNGWSYYQETGAKISSGTPTAYGASYTTGDVNGVLLKNGKLYFRKNGTWQNSANPDAETGEAYSGLTGDTYPAVSMYRSISPAHALTGRFRSSAFSGTLPLNVSAWES